MGLTAQEGNIALTARILTKLAMAEEIARQALRDYQMLPAAHYSEAEESLIGTAVRAIALAHEKIGEE